MNNVNNLHVYTKNKGDNSFTQHSRLSSNLGYGEQKENTTTSNTPTFPLDIICSHTFFIIQHRQQQQQNAILCAAGIRLSQLNLVKPTWFGLTIVLSVLISLSFMFIPLPFTLTNSRRFD